MSTDHCPFCYEEQPHGLKFCKRQGEREGFHKIPNGGPGIEHRIPVFFDGAVKKRGMTPSRFVELVATNPAKLFGIYPKKGTIAVGSDADIVLFDPNERWTIRAADQHTRVDYSLFEGFEVQGRVKKTFLRGQLIVGRRALARPRRHGRVPQARRIRPAVSIRFRAPPPVRARRRDHRERIQHPHEFVSTTGTRSGEAFAVRNVSARGATLVVRRELSSVFVQARSAWTDRSLLGTWRLGSLPAV